MPGSENETAARMQHEAEMLSLWMTNEVVPLLGTINHDRFNGLFQIDAVTHDINRLTTVSLSSLEGHTPVPYAAVDVRWHVKGREHRITIQRVLDVLSVIDDQHHLALSVSVRNWNQPLIEKLIEIMERSQS
jgi:hypothetical protein